MTTKIPSWACGALILAAAVVTVAGGEVMFGAPAAASGYLLAPGQTAPRTPPTRPRPIGTGITHNFLVFDVSLACDSAAVAYGNLLRRNTTAMVFETIDNLAQVDRIFARTDFFLDATIRLRPVLSATCFPDPASDPFISRTDDDGVSLVYATAAYRQTLSPSAGAVTHLQTSQNTGMAAGRAYLAQLGTPHAAGFSQIAGVSFFVMAHELGHNFGASHDGEPGSPCEHQAGDWLMTVPLGGGRDFSECSRMSMGNYVASLSSPVYELSLDAPPFANAGPDKELVGSGRVTLDATASTDNGDLEYFWEPDGNCPVSFPGYPGAAQQAVDFGPAPLSGSVVCRFLLTVTDNAGQVNYDAVTVTQHAVVRPRPPANFTTVFSDSMDMLTNWTRSGNWRQAPGVAEAYGCTTECRLTLNKNVYAATGTVTLSFKAGLTGMTGTGDYLRVDVLKGTTWYQVKSISGNNLPAQFSVDVSQYKSSAMRLRFRAKMSSTSKKATIDNVTISTQ